jgi:ABC-type multidrug transport system permease subunit
MNAPTKLLAIPLVVATLLAGTWFWGAVVAPGYYSAIVLVVAWFVLCSVIFGRIGKARPQLHWWLRGTFLACSAVSLVAFFLTSVRDTEVNEALPEAVPASKLAPPAPGESDPLAPQPEGG